MTEEQMKTMTETLGKQASELISKELKDVREKFEKANEEFQKNKGISEDTFKEYQNAQDQVYNTMKTIAEKQGIELAVLTEKLSRTPMATKSITQVFQESQKQLEKVYRDGVGSVEFMVTANSKGEFTMSPFDRLKAAGPHATVDGVGGGSNTASISTDITDPAAILRMGNPNSPIYAQYRNTPWIFDQVNVVRAGFDQRLATWYEEVPKQGAATVVAEGATKPLVQYEYVLKSASYKKVAQLLSFTDEFALDFPRLEDEIMNKGRIDLMNVVNTLILADLISVATPYNTASSFAIPPVDFANDFDAIAAMAAQVENATYGNMANAALMSTFKKYRMGVEKAETGEYLNRPDVLNNINFVGNPAMAADQVIVGDLKRYNIILRGGMIVKVGYNGTDFAENKFSVVMEQFYYNYMSAIHAPAIVKGPTFAAVKTAIGTGGTT